MFDAGPTVRPATGVVAGTSTLSALTALARPALITPNGDGRSDWTTVRYRIREASTVTGTLVEVLMSASEYQGGILLTVPWSGCSQQPQRT